MDSDLITNYIELALRDACREILERSGVHGQLSTKEWEAKAGKMAVSLRPAVEEYLAQVGGQVEEVVGMVN